MPTGDKNVAISVDGQLIAGTLIALSENKVPGILFVHGWGASQEEYLAAARSAAKLGCACLSFDMRGHAATKDQRDRVTREDNLRDVIAAYDVLASRPDVDAALISIVGSSYGAYLAAIATTKRSISCLALRAPAIYRDRDWEQPKLKLHEDQELLLYRRRIVDWNDNRALRACAAFRGDILIVESEYDAVVPHPVTESYAAACIRARSVTSHVIANADHALSEERWRRDYASLLINWITVMIVNSKQATSERMCD
jgi:pimeloyl-ACP methyl ester carboxylesterase